MAAASTLHVTARLTGSPTFDAQTFRQFRGLELIASENLTSLAVMEANGSMFTNKFVSLVPSPAQFFLPGLTMISCEQVF